MTNLILNNDTTSLFISTLFELDHGTVPISRQKYNADSEEAVRNYEYWYRLDSPCLLAKIKLARAGGEYVAATRDQIRRLPLDDKSSSTVPVETKSEVFARKTGLENLRQLRDGWMGEESVAPDKATLTDAHAFLSLLHACSLPEPMISASASGVIFFAWSHGRKKATAQLEGDGFFGYATYQDGRFRGASADGDLQQDSLPAELIAYLKGLCGNDLQL